MVNSTISKSIEIGHFAHYNETKFQTSSHFQGFISRPNPDSLNVPISTARYIRSITLYTKGVILILRSSKIN